MNNHLLLHMRMRDEIKQEAIVDATVNLVNEIGFVSCSVAKIAHKANVSPATLYIYFKNKEDLLVSTYVAIKKEIFLAMMQDFNEEESLHDIFLKCWKNCFSFIKKDHAKFQYAEQFANTPFADLVNPDILKHQYLPIQKLIEKGIEQKNFKNVPFDIMLAFIFFPIYTLSNKKVCKSFIPDDKNIEMVFSLSWDAIKY